MRLLANENVPLAAVEALRRAGHDTAWIRGDAPGSTDESVLQRSVREGRLLLTFDKDFGVLVYRKGARAGRGVVVFRLAPLPPDALARYIATTLASRSDWDGSFSVVEAGRVRMRPLP